MPGLVNEMLGSEYWHANMSCPRVAADPAMESEAVATRVINTYNAAMSYSDSVTHLEDGESFPHTSSRSPLLGVVIDSRVHASDEWIAAMKGAYPGNVVGTPHDFETVADTMIAQDGWYGTGVMLAVQHSAGTLVLCREKSYVISSSNVSDQYVGVRSDQVQWYSLGKQRFDPEGRLTHVPKAEIDWHQNILLPRLAVNEAYMLGGQNRMRVVAAHLLNLPEGITVRQPAPYQSRRRI